MQGWGAWGATKLISVAKLRYVPSHISVFHVFENSLQHAQDTVLRVNPLFVVLGCFFVLFLVISSFLSYCANDFVSSTEGDLFKIK